MNVAVKLPTSVPLRDLLAGHAMLSGSCATRVQSLVSDSRAAVPGCVFFAQRGMRIDGARFIDDAVRAGALAVVRQGTSAVRKRPDGVPEIFVEDLIACMASAAVQFHRDPSACMRVVGVTGTNGKTSVSHFIASALHGLAIPGMSASPCGLLGTLGYGLFGAVSAASHTTPDLLSLHALLAEFRDAGARHAVMEVSSHALEQRRVHGVRFHTAVFTNLSRDHLDYHSDMRAYAEAKRRLFAAPGPRAAVVNADDAFGREVLATLPAGVEAFGYSLRPDARVEVRGRLVAIDDVGLCMDVRTPWGAGQLVSSLAGRFNAANLLATLAVLGALDVPLDTALEQLACSVAPAGRMQRFGGGVQPLVVVDYAHTPDALETALGALRPHCRGRLWCVFGCGGERDAGKRPLMGEIAARLADVVIVTDDNPRSEDGDVIAAAVAEGASAAGELQVERDRTHAIRRTVLAAAPEDVVLVAGKGHEPYQDMNGIRRPFSDAEQVRAALLGRDDAPVRRL